jgi:hypothetical protein
VSEFRYRLIDTAGSELGIVEDDRPERGRLRVVKKHLPKLAITALAAGAVLLAAGVATGARSALPAGNLLQNPGAEASTGSTDGSGPPAPIPSWTTALVNGDPTDGGFMVVQYGASGGFPDVAAAAKIGGGKNFFGGGYATSVSSASQTVDVSGAAAQIDGGKVAVRLAADIGGFSGQSDSGTVVASFLDANGTELGKVTIGPVTNAQRGGNTVLLPRSAGALAPNGTRSIRVTMTATRTEGSWDDGYFDNLDLELGSGAVHPALTLRCSATRVLTATVAPTAGIASVTFSIARQTKTVSKAPFVASFRLGKLPKHLLVKASAAPFAGASVALSKQAPC